MNIIGYVTVFIKRLLFVLELNCQSLRSGVSNLRPGGHVRPTSPLLEVKK